MQSTLTLAVILAASSIPLLAATEGGPDDLSCDQWGTEAFFSRADAATTVRCLTTRDPNELADGGAPAWFSAAAHSGDLDVVRLLVETGSDLRSNGGLTPLHAAARHNENSDVLRHLLANGGDVRAVDERGWTPLHHAACWNDSAVVVESLVAAKADVSARDNDGYTPLHLAAGYSGNPDVLKTLVAAGADLGVRTNYGDMPLHVAARSNENVDVVRYLLANMGDVNVRGQGSRTALRYAVESNPSVAIVEALLAGGLDSNDSSGNSLGWTPLHFIAERLHCGGCSDSRKQHLLDTTRGVIMALVAAGADPNVRDDTIFEETPLENVFSEADASIMATFIEAGAEIEPDYTRRASSNEDPGVMQALIDAGADVAEFGVPTLLAVAKFNHNPDVVDVLLAAGVDIRGRDEHGQNALHHAAKWRSRSSMIRKLVAAGANLEARDRDGNTPLHAAALWSDGERHAAESIAALLDLGANPVARNAQGRTPWDVAQNNEALNGTDAYWQLNDARFAAPQPPGGGANQVAPGPPATSAATPSRTCEIPGYPRPSNVEDLGLSWCGSNVGFQRRAFALQAAGAWCAIVGGSSSSADQVTTRHREINANCDRLEAMQSPGTPQCRCPTGYRP